MKVGLFLGSQFAATEPPVQRFRELIKQVELAERFGFDSILLPQHYLADFAFLQPIPLLGYLAAATQRIRLGTCVFLLPLHNPVATAEEFATLDVLSEGRLIVGVGQGYRKEELDAFSVPAEERSRRLTQYLHILRRLWAGEEVTESGAFGKLEGARLVLRPVQPGGPPIWVGATGDKGIRRAGRMGDTWVGSPELLPEEWKRRLGVLQAGLAEGGHSLGREYPVMREVCVAASRDEAIELARPYLSIKYDAYRQWGHTTLTTDELIQKCCIVGTPEEALGQIRWYQDQGATHLVLRMQWPGMDQAPVQQTMRLLAEEVLPQLRSMG